MRQDAALRFGIAALATWRVTHLLAREDGPGDAVVRLRARAGDGQMGALMDCFQCASVWVAAPMTLAVTRRRAEALPVWLALSGAACLLQRPDDLRGGHDDGLLWTEAGGGEPEPALAGAAG